MTNCPEICVQSGKSTEICGALDRIPANTSLAIKFPIGNPSRATFLMSVPPEKFCEIDAENAQSIRTATPKIKEDGRFLLSA
jgi:hypothetical protein